MTPRWLWGIQENSSRTRRYPEAARLKASVVTAANIPSRRRVALPTTTATAAEAAPASRRAMLRSQCQSISATAPTVEPTAANDICPRLTWPDHPVSTTTEQPTMATVTRAEARMSSPEPIHSGNVQAAAKAASPATGVPTWTSVRSRAAAERSRTLPASDNMDSDSRSVWRASNWRTTMAPKTTAARTASPSDGLVGSSHATPCWRMPSATAEAAMTGNSVKLPRAMAASAVTSAVSPNVGSRGRPRMAAWKKMLTNERTPATTQVADCKRPTGMPSMEARSRRSPAACTAIPMSLRVNQIDTAARHTIETTTATRSLTSNTTGATRQLTCHGNVTAALAIGFWPQMRGISKLRTTRSWASPIVATVRTSRGERRNLRTTTISTVAVRRIEATRPVARPTK